MKMTVLGDVAPCSLALTPTFQRNLLSALSPHDGSSRLLRNIGQNLPDFMAKHTRKQPYLAILVHNTSI
jgi:hypothetical protein